MAELHQLAKTPKGRQRKIDFQSVFGNLKGDFAFYRIQSYKEKRQFQKSRN